MKRVRAETERIAHRCRQTARLSCELFDSLDRLRLDPVRFGELQSSIRQSLLYVEERLERLTDRIHKRRARLTRRCGEQDGFGRFLAGVIVEMKAREQGLRFERRLLRQSADVLAWIALDFQPNVIAPLFVSARHPLPRQLGLAGVAIIAYEAHRSRRFIVVENDLTRCLGVGDLTVVPFAQRWSIPLSLEVKTTGEYREGGTAEVNIHAVKVEGTSQAELLEELQTTLGFADATVGPALEHSHPKQAERLLQRGKYLFELGQVGMRQVEAQARNRWEIIARLIAAARKDAFAVEVSEPGVARIALRRNDSSPPRIEEIASMLEGLGFPRSYEGASTIEFQLDDYVSALIPPIATWALPLDDRVDLLTGNFELVTIVDPEVWVKAFGAVGLSLRDGSDEGYGWGFTREDGKGGFFPRLVAERVRLGVFYEVGSPRQTAEAVRKAIDAELSKPKQ